MNKYEICYLTLWVIMLLFFIKLDAQACLPRASGDTPACAELPIKSTYVFKCPNGQILTRQECGDLKHGECCDAYGFFNQIEPSAGIEATPLEPIDMQSEWLEQGQNLE